MNEGDKIFWVLAAHGTLTLSVCLFVPDSFWFTKTMLAGFWVMLGLRWVFENGEW